LAGAAKSILRLREFFQRVALADVDQNRFFPVLKPVHRRRSR
jgi:hypothetical protein